MNRRRIILVGALGLLAGVWWLQHGSWLSARLRSPIEGALSSALGRSVRIGGVGGGVSGWLWLHDVRIGPAPGARGWDVSATAEAVGLKLDAWQLLKGSADLSGLKAVQVIAPALFVIEAEALKPAVSVTPSAGSAPFEWKKAAATLPIPPVPIELERGALWGAERGKAPDLWAGGVYFDLEPQVRGGWHVRASGKPGGLGEASLSADCGAAFANARLEADGKDLAWPAWLKPPQGFAAPKGTYSGALEARPEAGAWPLGWAMDAKGSLEGASLQPEGRPGCTGIAASWSLRGARFLLSDLRGQYGGGQVQGEADGDLSARTFGATLTAQAVDLGVLAQTVGASPNLGLRGLADLDFSASGAVDAPSMSAEIRSQAAQWRGHPLTGIDLQASGGDGQWSGDGTLAWDGGRGSVSLDLDRGGLSQASLEVTAFPADWFDAFVGQGILGRVDGQGQFSRERGAWQLALKGTGLSVRGFPVRSASLQASGDDHTADLRADADLDGRPGLNGEVDAGRSGRGPWNLLSAKLYQRDRLLAQASGSYSPGGPGVPVQLSLTVKTSSLDVALVDPSLAAQGWSGKVRGSGNLAFDAGGWQGALRVWSASLARQNWAYPGAAFLGFGPAGVSITVRTLRNGEVTGLAHAPAWAGPWSGALRLSRARLAAYAVLTDGGVPRDLSGWASGSLEYSAGPFRRLLADLDFNDPLPRLLPGSSGHINLRREGGRWNVGAFSLVQAGGGSLKGRAAFDLDGKAPWAGEAYWKHFRVAGLSLGGSMRLGGGGGGPGRVVFAPWSVSDTALPPLDAAFSCSHGGVLAIQGRIGSQVTWSALPAGRAWNAHVEFADFDPGPWGGFLSGHGRATSLRLDGGIQGVLSPDTGPLEVSLDLRDEKGGRATGHWRRESGTAEVQGAFQSLSLGRLSGVCSAFGLGLPPLGGNASGSLRGAGASVTVSAAVDTLVWDRNKLGPASVQAGWNAEGLWVSEAQVGPDEGPFVKVEHAAWRRVGHAWTAEGALELSAWPVAIWTLDTQSELRASGGGGKLRWEARCASLDVGLRRWSKLVLGGTWDGRRYTVLEGSRRPAFSAAGTFGNGAFTLDSVLAYSGRGRGVLKGSMSRAGALDFTGVSSGLPASDLAGIMGWPQDWSGSAWGSLAVSGTLGKAHTVVSAKVEDGSVDGLPFDLGTGLVVQDGDWVDLSPVDPIRISRRDGTALEVRGRVTLLDDPPPGQGMDVWAELRRGGLRLFAGLPMIRTADGPLTLKLHFTGKPADPRVDGTFLLADGTLDPSWFLPPLEKVRVLAQIDDSKVTLQQADARVIGGGPLLKVEAADPGKPAFVFKDWVPAEMNLHIRASKSGLPLRVTPELNFVSGVAHPDLVLSGSWDKPAISGTVLLEKGNQDKAVVQWPPQYRTAPDAQGGGWFERLNYDLQLQARSDVMVRTGAAEVFVDTGEKGVLVKGAGADKSLYGHLRLVQGNVDYLLATFQLAQDHDSWLDMRGSEDPVVELWGLDDLGNVTLAGEGAPDVQILLHAWGPIGQVQMRLEDENDPSLSQDQLAAVLGIGGDSGDPRSQGGFTRMLGSVPAGFLTALVRKTGLLDEIGLSVPMVDQAVAPTPGVGDTGEVSPLSETTPTSATAQSVLQVSAGKYLGSKLFLGVNTEVMQHTDAAGKSQYAPEVGGVIQYQLPGASRLSVEQNVDTNGVTDQRVMLEASSQFANYDPNRRRWDGTPTPVLTATPSPVLEEVSAVSPTVTPTPGLP